MAAASLLKSPFCEEEFAFCCSSGMSLSNQNRASFFFFNT